MTNRHRLLKRVKRSVGFGTLMIFVIFAFFPIVYIIISSLRISIELWEYPPTLFGRLTLSNYIRLATRNPLFFTYLKNSMVVTLGAVAITLVFSFLAAFSFSRYRNRSLRVPAFFLIAVRMFPPIVITIPLFPVLNSMGMMDRYLTLIIINSAFSVSLATWMTKTFIDDVPVELEESAMIDGCSRFSAFLRITLPLTAPGLAAVAIFVAVAIWNEYTFAYIFSSSRAATAPIYIGRLAGHSLGVDWSLVFAVSVVQLTPMLVFVLLVQKYLIRGIRVGAIK